MSRNPSEETANPDSPTSSPTPPIRTPTNRLFSALMGTSEPSPSSPTTDPSPSSSPPLDADAAAPSWSTDAPPDPTDPPADNGATLSIGKSGKVSRAGLRIAIGGGFARICKLVAVLAADEEERATGLWRADSDDIDDVASPAASLIYRRLPEEARGSDAMDLLQLGLGLLGYVGKNLRLRSEIRTRRALQESYNITPDEAAQ